MPVSISADCNRNGDTHIEVTVYIKSRAVSGRLYTDAFKNGEEKHDYKCRLSFGTGNLVPEILRKGEKEMSNEASKRNFCHRVRKVWKTECGNCVFKSRTTPHINISQVDATPPQRL